jgi:hypothetical protein
MMLVMSARRQIKPGTDSQSLPLSTATHNKEASFPSFRGSAYRDVHAPVNPTLGQYTRMGHMSAVPHPKLMFLKRKYVGLRHKWS